MLDFIGVPGQYFCTYTYEDVQQLVIPVAEISRGEATELFDLVAKGEQIFTTLTSEGRKIIDKEILLN